VSGLLTAALPVDTGLIRLTGRSNAEVDEFRRILHTVTVPGLVFGLETLAECVQILEVVRVDLHGVLLSEIAHLRRSLERRLTVVESFRL